MPVYTSSRNIRRCLFYLYSGQPSHCFQTLWSLLFNKKNMIFWNSFYLNFYVWKKSKIYFISFCVNFLFHILSVSIICGISNSCPTMPIKFSISSIELVGFSFEFFYYLTFSLPQSCHFLTFLQISHLEGNLWYLLDCFEQKINSQVQSLSLKECHSNPVIPLCP